MDAINTLPQELRALAKRQPDRIAMRMKDYGIWHDITWTQYFENVKKVAMGLYALGVKRGDHVAIVGENKPEWLFSAMGVMSLGGIFVGVYTTNPAAECEYVVGHSEAVVFFCEDEEQFDKALVFRARTPHLKKLVVWEMEGLKHFDDPMLMSFADLLALGDRTDQENPGLFEQIVDEGKPDETASIIYTSGTTGPPKGAMIGHRNYLWIATQNEKITRMTADDETISFLPLNHVYEQIFDLMMHLRVGHIVNFTENTDTVMNDLRDVSPTLFHAVPRIWEKYHSAVVLKMADATWLKRMTFSVAYKIGSAYNAQKLAKKAIPFYLNLGYYLAYFCVFLET